jgi:hypothetical protein
MSSGGALVEGAVVAAGLIVGACIVLSSRVANAAPPEASATPASEELDEVLLRDGRRIRGRIEERAPGRWVVITTQDGRRRTFTWDTVQEIDAATSVRAPRLPTALDDAWQKRSGSGATYELRANLATTSTPNRTFRLSGTCSTGSGTAPVELYGQTARDGAVGFGGGIGGRAGYTYRTRPQSDGPSSWYAFRVGAGLDLLAYHMRAPVGLPHVKGGLCWEVAKSTYELEYKSSSSLVVQVPLTIGGQVAFGKLDEARWSGIVVGLAYAPTFVHAGVFEDRSSSHINPLGLELTLDFTVLHATGQNRPPEPHVRVGFFFAPHTLDSQPAIGTISIGAVWY